MTNQALTAIFVRQPERRVCFIGRQIQDLSRWGELSRIIFRDSVASERRKLALLIGGRDAGEHEDKPAGPYST
jgi:hypothetical protein